MLLRSAPKKTTTKSSLQTPLQYCKDVKKNPKKYPSNVRSACNSLTARQRKMDADKRKEAAKKKNKIKSKK
jgi:hypothetical protein